MVVCPICSRAVKSSEINAHIDSNCTTYLVDDSSGAASPVAAGAASGAGGAAPASQPPGSTQKRPASSFFQTPATKRQATQLKVTVGHASAREADRGRGGLKRSFDDGPGQNSSPTEARAATNGFGNNHDGHAGPASNPSSAAAASNNNGAPPQAKRPKTLAAAERAAPLAERMRPQTLDDVLGQELVGANGVLRALLESGRVPPSMILWGGPGTGKTTIARLVARLLSGGGNGRTTAAHESANTNGAGGHGGGAGAAAANGGAGQACRFIELNATSTGVAECKKLFTEAAHELVLTGRRTVIFCDELHRFSKSQQDVFLKPVEAGTITLVGATTENPSFRVQAALLSRCRTFTLAPLAVHDLRRILDKALRREIDERGVVASPLLDDEMLGYLAAFADGDARTALNLLELAISLTVSGMSGGRANGSSDSSSKNTSTNGEIPGTVTPDASASGDGATAADPSNPPPPPPLTKADIKAALTQTLVYDRGGDQHYDTISAFHKSVRGSDPDAALYYLARMLQSGEDATYIARRMVVIASEDVGLADNTLLPLAVAAHTAALQIGMPEARIPLAHCAVALSLAPKSTRAYRALGDAMLAMREPGIAALPIPLHLRNAPTRLLRDLGCGAEYKYPPNYKDGRVRQEYLPEGLRGRSFLSDRDLGTEVDPALGEEQG